MYNNRRGMPVIIVDAAMIGLYTLFYFIVALIAVIQYFSYGYGTAAVQLLLALIFNTFLYVSTTLMSAFSIKHKKLLIPVGMMAIYIFGTAISSFITMFYGPANVLTLIFEIFELVLAISIFVLTIVAVAIVRPFGRKYPCPQPQYGYGYQQPQYPQYQQPYPQQGYPQYQQPYQQPQYQQPYPQPQYQQPAPQPQPYPQQPQMSPEAAEEIRRAEELLNSGAITREQFYEIQRRALNK